MNHDPASQCDGIPDRATIRDSLISRSSATSDESLILFFINMNARSQRETQIGAIPLCSPPVRGTEVLFASMSPSRFSMSSYWGL